MKKLRKIILPVILILGYINGNAQQYAMFTHYMYNTIVINPAYAGSRDALTVTALVRSQWVDFKGAPLTQTLTVQSPLRDKRFGVGFSALNDKIGPINNTSLFLDFSYIMKLTEKSKLALGVSAGANIFQANLNTLLLDEQNDPVFRNNINNRVTPNFGFGAYYTLGQFYAGISVPDLLENNYSVVDLSNGNQLMAKEQRHYFAIAGAIIKITDNFAFKPSTLIKVTSAVPAQADLTAAFIIMKKLTVGVMYRTGDAVGGLVGVDVTDQFHVGYSFDWSYGLSTAKYNLGSHEILLRYDFLFFDKKQIHSPRYF